MQPITSAPFIISVGNDEIHKLHLVNWHEYTHYENFRAIKKTVRTNKPTLIIACIANETDEQLSKQVTQYIRDGLANQDTRIVLIHEPSFNLDEISWMEKLRVNVCLSAEEKKRSFNLTTLNREIDTFQYIDNNRRQHDAETEMLMCIAQFSRNNNTLPELFTYFSTALSTLCYSSCSFHLKIQHGNQGTIDYCNHKENDFINELNTLLNLPVIPDYLQMTINEKKPQIQLLTDKINLSKIEESTGEKIGSYLTFPIVVYDKTLFLFMYFIPDIHMDKVSMKQINVINKACEQLTMLLERRQAENSLKKQHHRLKHALVQLKTAKQELQHKEKMASIGQMAAGIAHEINNPLSYVISNFSSMDEYLTNIIQLQKLQSEFLDAIEIGQDKKIQELRSNISKFEEEEDIAFILDDIRDVVSESHNGLIRVKNIITDLKSFTHNQPTELEICNITNVVNDTLKILTYDLDDAIDIEKNIDSLPEFKAHNGLMQQVLLNLIKNAGQALSHAKTETPKITIATEYKNSSIYITVQDNGPGISQAHQEKIFDPFFTTKTVGEGTGLGLSVTFNIIKKLGGVINVESQPNEFTRFIIVFPKCNDD